MQIERKRSRFTLTAGLWLGLLFHTAGQEIAIGQWRDHLPYQNVKRIARADDRIYCATNFGLFEYSFTDQSIQRLSSVNGLSDFGVSTIEWSDDYNLLIIAYNNANIDIIENNKIYNISDIKRKSILGDKSIKSVLFIGPYAYLSCGFGIVVLDITKKEVKETYVIGPGGSQLAVNALTYDGTWLYAATEKGVYKAKANDPNLVNFAVWSRYEDISQPAANYNMIASFNGKLIVNKNGAQYNTDTLLVNDGMGWTYFNPAVSWTNHGLEVHDGLLYLTNYFSVESYDTSLVRQEQMFGWSGDASPMHAIPESPGLVWIADSRNGLIRYSNPSLWQIIAPNGPISNNVADMDIRDDILWVASGGVSESFGNLWRTEGIFKFDNQSWVNINKGNTSGLDTLFDPIKIITDPVDAGHIFVGSWARGLAEFRNGSLVTYHTDQNSALQRIDLPNFYWIGVGGLDFDEQGNLWITNTSVLNPLVVKRNNGTWKSFSLSPYVTTSHNVSEVLSSQSGQQWVIIPRGPTKGIVVFDSNGTIDNTSDDKKIMLRTGVGSGNLPSDEVLSIAEDRDGEIWVGTRVGPVIYYTPEFVMSGGDAADAQRVLVERDGFTEYLLDGTAITSIAIDGANRKWLGTELSGVFLLSEDGTEELAHFTSDNSPLISNKINNITINPDNGEVFFATDQGLISYKASATEGGETFEEVLVYPNPVKENYEGPIAIRGLVEDANVKITTASGSVVYETTALGGQAIWNGRNFDGVKAATGIYLVFCTNEDGSETMVTKILVIRGI
ncbi:MAG: hypothetical protein KDD36_04965 [Flavobacteriales bacterium]|nr:hypothetical protein [Flavobacteriales bacterium]